MAEKQLNQVQSGENFSFVSIPSHIKSDLIRLGLCEGDLVKCISRIPGGPVVVEKDLVQIAIGNNYASEISISQ